MRLTHKRLRRNKRSRVRRVGVQRIGTHSVRRPAIRWRDHRDGPSCVRPATRCPKTVCDIADKTWCWPRPLGRRAAGARPCGVRLPENKKNVPENNNKTKTSGICDHSVSTDWVRPGHPGYRDLCSLRSVSKIAWS